MYRSNEELTRLSDLIGLIYDGATDPIRWTQDILPAMADYFQAPRCILFTNSHTPQNGGYFFLHGITQDHVDLYMNKYQSEDVWTLSALEKKLAFEGSVVLGDELVPREQLLGSKFYTECLSRDRNMAHLMACYVFGMDSVGSLPTVCSFFRGLHHPDFSEKNRARMRLVLPHLSRSLGVMQRLRSAELTVATSLAALDRLPSGILLMNGSGAVAFANRSAQRILEDDDGLRLRKLSNTTGFGKLLARNTAAGKAIDDAICAALNLGPYATPHFSKYVTVPRPSGLANYTLQFSALGNHSEFTGGSDAFAAIVFISDGAQETEIDPALLENVYGLTPAEARVAVALLKYSSAQDVADFLGTSPHTVRTQIKQIYAKLGVDTRTRFVKLLLGLGSHSYPKKSI
ncbi:MAG: helix-turn-helix transcriptional regulator [Burkholderiales bacterium]